jgi:hypothetical protein
VSFNGRPFYEEKTNLNFSNFTWHWPRNRPKVLNISFEGLRTTVQYFYYFIWHVRNQTAAEKSCGVVQNAINKGFFLKKKKF